MGLLDKIFKRPKNVDSHTGWKTFTEQNPFYLSYEKDLFKQELTRAAIDRFATTCSKLKPEIQGESNRRINRAIRTQPNDFQTWPQFLYRLATIYENDATAYVVPTFERDMSTINGFWPMKCDYAEVVDFHGEPWVRFRYETGDESALELKYVTIVSKFQYESDFFGTPNCLDDTMKLIQAQSKAQENAIKTGSQIRFIGALTGQVREEDMKKKRERFAADNLNDNSSGLMLYDQTFQSVQQIDSKAYTIDPDEMERIQDNVCTYFGICKEILQNNYDENIWGSYYEGKVEPFAIQLGEGLTKMCFTQREQIANRITFSSSRLEYATNASKRNMGRDMIDRSVMSINEVREMLQLPPVEDGDMRVIRGEYINVKAVDMRVGETGEGGYGNNGANQTVDRDNNGGDMDQYKKDSDAHNAIDTEDDKNAS